MMMMKPCTVGVLAFLLLCAPSALGQPGGGSEEDRLFFDKNSDENSTSLACRAVTWPVDRCIASETGNPNISIKLIAEYALDIYQFLTTSVDFTSIKQFFNIVEQSINPRVETSKLTCTCERPTSTASLVPWNCTADLSDPLAAHTCECKNSDSSNAFCDISISCPPLNPIAHGGRCNNEVQYATSEFHFDDIGFGVPGLLPLPTKTICNAEVSRGASQSSVKVEAYAYCKKV